MFHDIAAKQLALNKNGMIFLLVWALGNIIVGLVLSRKHQHSVVKRSFYRANAAWNVVNLLIAGGTLIMINGIIPANLQLKQIIYQFFTFEKLLLLNMGLDIAYVAIGSYLVERSQNIKKPAFAGYGRSLWLQGGFLFLLDIVLYLINNSYNQRYAFFVLF